MVKTGVGRWKVVRRDSREDLSYLVVMMVVGTGVEGNGEKKGGDVMMLAGFRTGGASQR